MGSMRQSATKSYLCFCLIAALNPEGVRELFDARKNDKGLLGLHGVYGLGILNEYI